jgi:hypothetical protein
MSDWIECLYETPQLKPDTMVDVLFRNGDAQDNKRFDYWCWECTEDDYDIVAYKLSEIITHFSDMNFKGI